VTYGVIVYAMIGFDWTAEKFFWYLFFMYFTLLYFTFYGMMAVAVTPNHHVASIVAAAFYAIWNLFSGFVVPRPVSIIIQYYIESNYFNGCVYIMCILILFSYLLLTEHSCMVEMVLLGMSSCMDHLWIGCISIWRYNYFYGC
jgi:hypothetical protein